MNRPYLRIPSFRAFTLLELLVVIGIITILIGLSVVVGTRVIASGRVSSTQDSIRLLDSALNGFIQDAGRIPDPFIADPRDRNNIIPIADAMNLSASDENPINSVGLFMLQMGQSTAGESAFAGVDSEIIRLYFPYISSDADSDLVVPELRTMFDPWGNPLRYVHPTFQGELLGVTYDPASGRPNFPNNPPSTAPSTTEAFLGPAKSGQRYGISSIRRNAVGDSDGGFTQNQKPYFYSPGPDGDPSTLEDNVYTTKPATAL